MKEGVGGAGLVVSSDEFANAVDARAGDGNFQEEFGIHDAASMF